MIRITITRENAPAGRAARSGRISKRSVAACLTAAAALVAAGGVALAATPAASRAGAPGVAAGRGSAVSAASYASARHGITGLSWAGPWRAGAQYTAGDVVTYQGSSYVATAPSSGRVPSLSGRAWVVFAAAGIVGQHGATGPPGPAGAQGPPGVSGYAEYYLPLLTTDTITPGSDVAFDHNGPAAGGVVSRDFCTPNRAFRLSDTATYEVLFQAPVATGGELELTLDNQPLSYTVAGTTTGSQIVGMAFITATAGDYITVRNPTGNVLNTLIDASVGIGEAPAVPSLLIEELAGSQFQAHVLPILRAAHAGSRPNAAGAGPRRRNRQRC